MILQEIITSTLQRAKEASAELVKLNSAQKNEVLLAWAEELSRNQAKIREMNGRDIEAATAAHYPASLINRLTLSDRIIEEMIMGLKVVADLPDPIGEELAQIVRPNGLVIVKRRVPIGVIAIIYESRPNVTVDAAALCFKAGNAVVLRGGKEAFNSNCFLVKLLQECSQRCGVAAEAVQIVPTLEHEAVRLMIQQPDYVDLVIPRGGEKLIRAVCENSFVPVIKHYKGNCHIYVDKDADLEAATKIIINAKCQRPGVCNAIEKLLIHRDVANYLTQIAQTLSAQGVRIKIAETDKYLYPQGETATDADWSEEYLDLVIAIKTVDSVTAAISHINKYGSHHSDAILSADQIAVDRFVKEIDSAVVYANASTRFTDGGEFGMGAEIGISTDKIHARGPMGLAELTTYKYEVRGQNQIRE